ncbi:hypothetical protein ECZU27_17690 [Escherichia coli]|nr:hypothetical protein ECZU27_17690 [Escherichia coli]
MNPLLTDSRRQALRSASHWYAVLSGERVSPQQEARWQQWYEQDQDNQWAGSRLKTCATSWRCAATLPAGRCTIPASPAVT